MSDIYLENEDDKGMKLINSDYSLGIVENLEAFAISINDIYDSNNILYSNVDAEGMYLSYLAIYLSLTLKLNDRIMIDKVLNILAESKCYMTYIHLRNIFNEYPSEYLLEWIIEYTSKTIDQSFCLYESILLNIDDPKTHKNISVIIDILVKYYDIVDICTFIIINIINSIQSNNTKSIPKLAYFLPYLTKHGFSCDQLPDSIRNNKELMNIIDSVLTDV